MSGLPLWLRIAKYAEAQADEQGAVRLQPWELLKAMDPLMIMHPSQISRAIRTAVGHGFLAPGSTARHLVVPPPPSRETSPRGDVARLW